MIGGILILMGLLLRLLAIRALGHRFSLVLRIPDFIVTTGPYKYMRHPSYIGSLLMILGAGMIHSTFGIVLLAVMFFAARIVDEENLLMRNPNYRDYYKKTGLLGPRLRRRK